MSQKRTDRKKDIPAYTILTMLEKSEIMSIMSNLAYIFGGFKYHIRDYNVILICKKRTMPSDPVNAKWIYTYGAPNRIKDLIKSVIDKLFYLPKYNVIVKKHIISIREYNDAELSNMLDQS